VTAASAEGQSRFDEGLLYLYAFHHDQAIRAFSAAAAVDPRCAMAHWGVALANGPHINNPAVDPEHAHAAVAALALAQKGKASPVERDLINALMKRYADPQPPDRKPLDLAYAYAMREVWKAHPDDADIGALFAEALMDLRPWDLWLPDGNPQPETPEILATLEKVLQIDPQHPMGNHLYIHALEASPDPGRGLEAANRLRDLRTALGHLVHMPSHIYVRTGRWQEAVLANESAIAADHPFQEEKGFYQLYMLHNRHMLAWAAIMRGQSQKALAAIDEAIAMIPPDWVQQNAALIDGFMAMPLEVRMRFGRWDEVLAAPDFPDHLPLAQSLRHAARAIAFSVKGQPAQAMDERLAFVKARTRVAPDATFGNNSAADLLRLTEHLVGGEVSIQEHHLAEGILTLKEAVSEEDKLRYDEPPDWIQPVRHALGAALLRAGRAAEAEAVFREDLRRLPDNGWSLWGLARALELQKKDAAATRARFSEIWGDADLQLSSSCLCLPGI
jgi:tetratricopeptide (TPR) repeat protein